MHSRNGIRFRSALALILLSVAGIALTARFLPAQATGTPAPLEPSFEQYVKAILSAKLYHLPQLGYGHRGHPGGPTRRQTGRSPYSGLGSDPEPGACGDHASEGPAAAFRRRPPARRRVDRKRPGSCPLASGPEERNRPAPDRGAVSEHDPRIAVARRRSDREPSTGRGLQRRVREQQGHSAIVAVVDGSLFRDRRSSAGPFHRRSQTQALHPELPGGSSARASIRLLFRRSWCSARTACCSRTRTSW